MGYLEEEDSVFLFDASRDVFVYCVIRDCQVAVDSWLNAGLNQN